MNRTLRELPRINYNWKIQARVGESDKTIKAGTPQRRGSNKKEMGIESPLTGSNTSLLTMADKADFTGLNIDQLNRKIKNRAAKLKNYQRILTGEDAITLDIEELNKYGNKIKDQLEYLDKLVTHLEEEGFEDAANEADEIITDLQDVLDIIEKEMIKKPVSSADDKLGNLTNTSKFKSPMNSKELLNFENTSTPKKIKNKELTGGVKVQVNLLQKRVDLLKLVVNETAKLRLDTALGEDRLLSLKATDLPKMEGVTKELSKLFDDNIDKECYADVCNDIMDSIEIATYWIQTLHELIKIARLDIADDSRTNIEPIKLDPFNGWKSTIDVYVFLEDFNRLLSTSRPATKLLALYKNYLSPELAREVEHLYLSEDYKGMITYLINKYGNARRILDNKKKQLQSLRYNSRDVNAQISFFRTFHHVLLNLNALLNKHNHEVPDLENELYNQSFLHSLVSCLPDYHKKSFIKMRGKEQRNFAKRLTEKEEFKLFQRYVSYELDDLESFAHEHGTTEDDHDKVNKLGVHTVDAKEVIYGERESSKPFSIKKVNVKCFIHEVVADFKSHPVGQCSDFLSASPKQRLESARRLKICQLCLGDWCGRYKSDCCNKHLVPESLICQQCSNRNILLCPDHRTDEIKIGNSLEYLNGYERSRPIQVNHININHVKSAEVIGEYLYDVSTGEKKPVDNSVNIIDIDDQPGVHMTQILNIDNRDCLVMYDSGSSVNVVEEDFANLVDFNLVERSKKQISVAGGSILSGNTGFYSCVIGPLTDSKYARIKAVGLKRLTNPVPEFDLKTNLIDDNKIKYEKLPSKIGGMAVKLIIGVGSTDLFPEKIMEFHNGLVVFRSKFADKFGSTLIFSGPDHLFKASMTKAIGKIIQEDNTSSKDLTNLPVSQPGENYAKTGIQPDKCLAKSGIQPDKCLAKTGIRPGKCLDKYRLKPDRNKTQIWDTT